MTCGRPTTRWVRVTGIALALLDANRLRAWRIWLIGVNRPWD